MCRHALTYLQETQVPLRHGEVQAHARQVIQSGQALARGDQSALADEAQAEGAGKGRHDGAVGNPGLDFFNAVTGDRYQGARAIQLILGHLILAGEVIQPPHLPLRVCESGLQLPPAGLFRILAQQCQHRALLDLLAVIKSQGLNDLRHAGGNVHRLPGPEGAQGLNLVIEGPRHHGVSGHRHQRAVSWRRSFPRARQLPGHHANKAEYPQ